MFHQGKPRSEDQPTDRPTDRQTDGPTDQTKYSSDLSSLKKFSTNIYPGTESMTHDPT